MNSDCDFIPSVDFFNLARNCSLLAFAISYAVFKSVYRLSLVKEEVEVFMFFCKEIDLFEDFVLGGTCKRVAPSVLVSETSPELWIGLLFSPASLIVLILLG